MDYKKKVLDILIRYIPLVPVSVLNSAAEEIVALHEKENEALSKHVDNMLDKVGE